MPEGWRLHRCLRGEQAGKAEKGAEKGIERSGLKVRLIPVNDHGSIELEIVRPT